MFTNVKTRVRQTRRFVQEHQTVCACAVTAVATYAVTNSHNRKVALKFAAESGRKHGQMDVYLDTAYEFIESKDLTHEFITEFCQQKTA